MRTRTISQRQRVRRHLPIDHARPRTRGECTGVGAIRPCPYVGCRHHLAVDVTRYGSARIDTRELEDMPDTCSLDVADRGEHSREDVAKILGVTRSWVEAIENTLTQRLRERGDFDPPE